MATLPRATFLMEHGKISWSETHWHVTGSTPIGLDQVLSDAVVLGALRCGLFGTDLTPSGTPKMPAVRVSFDDTFRDSLLSTETAGNEVANAKDEGNNVPEVPWSVVLLRMESGSIYRKNLYLSGCPQNIITDPPGPVTTAPFDKAFAKWRKELLSGKWGFKVKSKDPAIAPEKPVVTIAAHTGDNQPVLTCDVTGIVAGDRVMVRGGTYAPGSTKIHGTFFVNTVQGGQLFLSSGTYSGGYQGGAVVRKLVYQVVPYTSVIIRGETHRKRGVLGGSPPRGRSKKRT